MAVEEAAQRWDVRTKDRVDLMLNATLHTTEFVDVHADARLDVHPTDTRKL